MTEKDLPQFIHHESSPLGDILLAADEVGLTGLWFEGQKNYVPRGQIRQQRTEQVAQMQPSARRGRKASRDRRAHASISGVLCPLLFFSPSGVSSSISSF